MIELNKWITRLSIVLICTFILNVNIAYSDGADLVVAKRGVLGAINDPPEIGVGEYIEAGSFSKGKGSFQIQTYRSADGSIEEIQFYFKINDPSPSPNEDQIRIRFDLDHNHSVTVFDRGIRIFRQLSGGATNNVRITDVNLFGASTDKDDLPGDQWSVESGVLSWTAEVKIRAADLGLNFIPSLIGMHIRVTPSSGLYPSGVNASQIDLWTNLKTRRPLEYVILLDESGSMLRDFDGTYPPITTQRWQAAKKASDIFTQIYYAFRPKEDGDGIPYFNDKIGLATYYWDDGDVGSEDKSGAVYPLEQSKMITVDGYVDNNGTTPPVDPVFGQHTPIKRGLDAGFGMFGTGDIERIVILMSDGIHDRPSSDYDAEAYNFPLGLSGSDFQVNTVALGPDGSVGTDLLNDISSIDFPGFGGSYINTLKEQELVDFFAENLFSHYYINRVDISTSGPSTGQFDINLDEPQLLVILVWNTEVGTNRHFWLKKPDSTLIQHSAPPAGVTHHHYRDTTLNYEVEYYLIEFPDTGTWQTVQTDGSTPEVADNAFALLDPTIYAFFTVVQDGDDFILRTVLKEKGLQITEPSASVVVDVSKPDEGLGTYSSTAQQNCKFAPPVLPQEFDPKFIQHERVVIAPAIAINPKENPEQLPPHFAKVQALFNKCDKSGLYRSRGSLQLYDDGTHGDTEAGDGIFTLRYTDTQHEGTYTFNFIASGNAPSNSVFSRIKTLSIHKSVNVAPESTVFDLIERFREGNFITTEFYVIPKDRKEEYLGPGHVNQIEFKTTAGKFVGPIRNYNNGIYSRVLQYDETQDRPVVTAIVQGKELSSIRVFKPFELEAFVGRFFFDNSLGLDDATVAGARLGYQLTNQLALELEGAVTFTEDTAGDSGHVYQALANVRYDLYSLRVRRLVPYVTAGAGYVFFRGFGMDDEAPAVHGGVGSTFELGNSFGIQVDARVLQIGSVMNAGSTTNLQVTGGLLFRF